MGFFTKYWQILKWFLLFARFRCRQYQLKTNDFFVLNTDKGPIKGIKRKTIWNKEFFSFEKIPFAKPPIGELRFKAPQPAEKWQNVLDCTKQGPPPVQQDLFRKKHSGNEDCLYLNVYTKNLKPVKDLPVMVWIYGGGFKFGGTSTDIYSPDYFMEEEVVLITITYRLGPLGFLSIDDEKLNVPGNAGLKDQVLALQWIKNNCKEFGGDPENITVFGESAGAASTHYMMLNKKNENLFHKAILMSGCSLAPWAQASPSDRAFKLAQMAGYTGGQGHESVFNFLKTLDASAIVAAEMKVLNPEDRKNRILFAFGPVVEPYITDDCVIPEDPKIMMRNSWSNNIPILIGGTSFEGLISYPEVKRNPKIMKSLNNCEYLVPLELNLQRSSEKCHELGLRIKNAHFGEKTPENDKIFEYLQILSYKLFWHSLTRTIKSRLKYASSASTYLYRFDFDSPDFNHVRSLFCGRKVRGTCHADDLSYIFLNAVSKKLHPQSKEYQTIRFMTKTLTHFAATGDPNNESYSMKWNPVENNKTIQCLNIADEILFIDLPENEKLKVWNGLYENVDLI